MDLSLKMWSAIKVLKIINIITLADAVTFYLTYDLEKFTNLGHSDRQYVLEMWKENH